MDEPAGVTGRSDADRSDARDELRTIGFRLREIQRLLSIRVQQENRRLEAGGLDPVTTATFFKQPQDEAERQPEP